MHVNLDRVGHGVTDVVVGGLAGQNGMEVRPLEVLNQERVDRLACLVLLVAPVHQGVFSPPVQLGRRGPCRSGQFYISTFRAAVFQEIIIFPNP